MSQENVELTYRAADAFNRRDFAALEEMTHEDLVFTSALTAVDADGGIYRGAGAWRSYFQLMDEAWADWQVLDIQVFVADKNRVASTFRLVGTGRTSGARVEQQAGMAYEFREGKLWRLRSYLNPGEALEAVGLAE